VTTWIGRAARLAQQGRRQGPAQQLAPTLSTDLPMTIWVTLLRRA
jgi:hypothetical protein